MIPSLQFCRINGTTLTLPILLLSFGVIIYQRCIISQFHHQTQNSAIRHKRAAVIQPGDGAVEYLVDTPPPPPSAHSDDNNEEESHTDHPFYFPLYTQLSSKVLERICHEKFGIGQKDGEAVGKAPKADIDDNRTKLSDKLYGTPKAKHRKGFKEKVCAPFYGLGQRHELGYRIHRDGSAMRTAHQWFLTEYTNGNILFQFDTAHMFLNESEFDPPKLVSSKKTESSLGFPTAIHTLTESFRGTDHTIGHIQQNELVFYYEIASSIPRIEALYLSSGRRITRLVNASKAPLYNDPNRSPDRYISSIDLEIDQSALWATYKQPDGSELTVSKMSPHSLKETGKWHLSELNTTGLLNTFVACGTLYTVRMDSNRYNPRSKEIRKRFSDIGKANSTMVPTEWVSVQPAFEFRSSRYVGQNWQNNRHAVSGWFSYGAVSNVQYDSQTDSLNVFDYGHIYTISMKRKRFA